MICSIEYVPVSGHTSNTPCRKPLLWSMLTVPGFRKTP